MGEFWRHTADLMGQSDHSRRHIGESRTAMTQIVIQFDQAIESESCTICGGPAGQEEGPRLSHADNLEPVCRQCGHAHAPWLVALVDLASTAERVGRIGRHTLVPPLTSLLDLARAAEDYTSSRCVQQAA
jgi:hypothetical protein